MVCATSPYSSFALTPRNEMIQHMIIFTRVGNEVPVCYFVILRQPMCLQWHQMGLCALNFNSQKGLHIILRINGGSTRFNFQVVSNRIVRSFSVGYTA